MSAEMGAPRDDAHLMTLAMKMLVRTGIRSSELVGLRWSVGETILADQPKRRSGFPTCVAINNDELAALLCQLPPKKENDCE